MTHDRQATETNPDVVSAFQEFVEAMRQSEPKLSEEDLAQ
jgi:hypothetical protein